MPRPVRALSDQLRQHIESRGLSAYELAAASGIHRASLSRFLRRERTLSQDAIDRLCSALKLTLVPTGRRRQG